jgi:hypothetical protein
MPGGERTELVIDTAALKSTGKGIREYLIQSHYTALQSGAVKCTALLWISGPLYH